MSREIPGAGNPTPEAGMLVIPCRRCGAEITAGSEDELVERVHAHIRSEHGSEHAPAREHLLAHARRI
jgi:predicted small metal-binding protein